MLLALPGLALACSEADPERSGTHVEAPAGTSTPIADQAPVVFTSDRASPGENDLYAMSPDGTNVRRLTVEGGFNVPSWSPDGASIAFRQVVDGVHADVGVLSPDDGSPPVLLTHGENARTARMPLDWSSDGSRITFTSWGEANDMFLWNVPKTGGNATRLFPDIPCCQQSAVWSADGTQVAYLTHNETRTLDLWLTANGGGSEPLNVTQGRIFAPLTPRWSPDGTRIALAGYAVSANGKAEGLDGHGASHSVPDTEIFILTLTTLELTRLTDNDSEDFAPTWSPDGSALLVASDRDGDFDLWRVSLDAPHEAQNLIDDAVAPSQDEFPSWYRPR